MPSRSPSRQGNNSMEGRSSRNSNNSSKKERAREKQLREIEAVSRANRRSPTPSSKDRRAKSLANHIALPSDPTGSSLTFKQRQAIISIIGPAGIITTKPSKNNNHNGRHRKNRSEDWDEVQQVRKRNRKQDSERFYDIDRSREQRRGSRPNSVASMMVERSDRSMKSRNRSIDSVPSLPPMKQHKVKMQQVNFQAMSPRDRYIPKRTSIYDYIDPRTGGVSDYARITNRPRSGTFDLSEPVYHRRNKMIPRIRDASERLHQGLRWGSPLPPNSPGENFQVPYSVLKEWEMERKLTMPQSGPESVRERMLKYNYMLGVRKRRWALKHGKGPWAANSNKIRPRSESPPNTSRYDMLRDIQARTFKPRSRSKSVDFYYDEVNPIVSKRKLEKMRRMSLDSSQVYYDAPFDQSERRKKKEKKAMLAELKRSQSRERSVSMSKRDKKNKSAEFHRNRSRDNSNVSMKREKKNMSADMQSMQRNKSKDKSAHKEKKPSKVLSEEQQLKLAKKKAKSEKLPLVLGDAGSQKMKKLKHSVDKSDSGSVSGKANKSQVRFEGDIKNFKSKNRSASQSAKLSGDVSNPPFDYDRIREIDEMLRLTKAYLENSVSQSSLASRTNSAKSFYAHNTASHAVNSQ